MTIILFLDGTPYRIDGGSYPAGVGLPRVGEQVVVSDSAYKVTSVQWFIIPLDSPALRVVEIRAMKIGGKQ